MTRFHLFLIVLSACQYHLAHGGQKSRRPVERGRHGNGVTFATEIRKVRPIQQLFYNIYIQDSPSIHVNNIIHTSASPARTKSSLVRSGGVDDRGSSTTETDAESWRRVIDAVNGELFRHAVSNNKTTKFKVEDDSENGKEDVPVGNVWRSFTPTTEDKTNGNSQLTNAYGFQYGRPAPQHAKTNATERVAELDASFSGQEQRRQPTYGRHTYEEILRKLYSLRAAKKKEKQESAKNESEKTL